MDDFKSKRCASGLIWMLTRKTEAGIKEKEEKSAVRAEPQRHKREELGRKNGKISISSWFFICHFVIRWYFQSFISLLTNCLIAYLFSNLREISAMKKSLKLQYKVSVWEKKPQNGTIWRKKTRYQFTSTGWAILKWHFHFHSHD